MTDAPDPFSTAKANLRDTIKWLATSLAAVGAAVIAGASINGLASLHGKPLIVATILGSLGLLLLLVAIGILVQLLTSRMFYFSDLRDPENIVTKEINDHAGDVLSPQTPTVAELIAFREESIRELRASKPGEALYDLAFRKWTAANDMITRVTNLGQFIDLRNKFNEKLAPLFALAIFTILALGGYAMLAGAKSEVASQLSAKIVLKPGRDWADVATAIAKTCGSDPLNGSLEDKKSFDGWVTVKFDEPGKCSGLEVTVPSTLVQLSPPAP